jgi:hypothetical protein
MAATGFGAKIIPCMKVRVTKLDAAKRQLETAIMLYFHDGDPVSIHTLCCAAYSVIHALNKKRNSPISRNDLMLKDLDQYLATKADKKLFRDSMSASQNFFKHGATDPDAEHTFNTEFTERLLIDAVQKYSRLVGECPRIMTVYFVWFTIQHTEIMSGPWPVAIRKNLKRVRAVTSDRKRFYAEYCR